MLSNGNISCGLEDDIVSYIYDELIEAERTRFESHLSGCSGCTDEFAAIADARFSAYEWQKEEFALLPTPDIVIPYAPKKHVAAETARSGLFSGLYGWLPVVNFPVAVAAGLVICFGLGFLILNYLERGEHIVASSTNVVLPPIEPPNSRAELYVENTGTSKVTATTVKPKSEDIRPMKAIVRRQPTMVKHSVAGNLGNRDSTPTTKNAPVLSNYDDNDDNSLRLAELFDDVGS